MNLIPKVVLLAAAFGLTACDVFLPRTCTLKGCAQQGLTLNVVDSQGQPVPAFYGQVTIPGAPTIVNVIGCSGSTAYGDGDGSCDNGLSVAAFRGLDRREKFHVAVRNPVTGEQFCGEPDLSWTETEINGPGCGTCSTAQGTIHLGPAGACEADLTPVACSIATISGEACANPLRVEVLDTQGVPVRPEDMQGTLVGEYSVPFDCENNPWLTCDATGIAFGAAADPTRTYSLTVNAGQRGKFSGSVVPTFTANPTAYAGCIWCGRGDVTVTLTEP